ncbi:MAG TPA: dephospho-CoA kinase [Acholeplasmataceae bacterium]|nr:dephospho-CoA kinase [Acholeplasmataceae bacterium]
MIIGITGSIGTGKSVVTKYLANSGYPVLDSDLLAGEELKNEEVIKEIVSYFGELVLSNGKIDRKKLGELIFRNKSDRETLNRIIHPRVIAKIEEKAKQAEGLLFVDVPLLFEAKLEHLFAKIIVVYTSKETQLKRLMVRDRIDEEYALAKIAAQMDIEEKKKRADYLVNNEGDLENTYKQIENILRRIENEIW